MVETYPTQIKLTKTLPTSNFYTGSGATTIVIHAENITVNCKKSLIKMSIPTSPNSQLTGSDIANSYILDLKKIEDNVKLTGVIIDDEGETAWNKAWKLRSMCASGNQSGDKGALTTLAINDIVYNSGTTTAFLEEVTFTVNKKENGAVNNLSDNAGAGVARINVDLSLYIGNAK